ncbi:hypothetical protein B0H17DRAFT_932959 [Mycena rosella]|uniref:Uncharacterized protein n=1 Tax=Mycena rosella TaxID=1033263 RepID=A0AAD7DKF7_MYCRO|nr:hypothetical protein B0H17DRAFT_932959 [Mycena rosella]
MASTPESAADLRRDAEVLLYVVFGLVAQTLFFGIYTLLMALSTRMLLKRGLKTRANRVMFFIILFMYILSAGYWAFSVAFAADSIQTYIDAPRTLLDTVENSDHEGIKEWLNVFNAVALINVVLSDGVVVWRASIICQRRIRKYLWIAIAFLFLTAMAVIFTIGFRIAGFIMSPAGELMKIAINILQVSTLGFSLSSNLVATVIVGTTARRHRQIIRAALKDDEKTRSEKILALVVEAGFFYCISGLIVLLASLFRIQHGTLGDLYGPIHLEITSAYPPIVILLVNTKRSLSESFFSETSSSESEPSDSTRFHSAHTSPTTTISGPDLIHSLKENSEPANKKRGKSLSRFSDDSTTGTVTAFKENFETINKKQRGRSLSRFSDDSFTARAV